jgi:hypothetical protein
MKVKDLHKLNGSYDIVDDLTGDLEIGVELNGKEFLTDYGKEVFADVLELECEIRKLKFSFGVVERIVVKVDDDDDDDEDEIPLKVQKLIDLFVGFAGFVDEKTYNLWFVSE